TPSWYMTAEHAVDVPLNTIAKLDVISIHLVSAEEFIPILNFSDSQSYLQLDGNQVSFSSDVKDVSPFTEGNHTLSLHQLLKEMHSHMNDTSKDTPEVTEATIINVSSQKGSFFMSLNISNKLKNPPQG
ncbi:unnamed protein product, partial [Meganyctiphanes norvegica]